MSFEMLDVDELLRLGLDAMNGGRDADALVVLKTLVERDPAHVMGRYLLAAQHAQMGLMDRAEAGFRDVVARAPEFPVARFQLGQLLLTQGNGAGAAAVLLPLRETPGSIGRFAEGLIALAQDDAASAVSALGAGLELPQEIPALASDMQRLLDNLRSGIIEPTAEADAGVAPIFLTGYGRSPSRDD